MIPLNNPASRLLAFIEKCQGVRDKKQRTDEVLYDLLNVDKSRPDLLLKKMGELYSIPIEIKAKVEGMTLILRFT